MLESDFKSVNKDIKVLLKDAQGLFTAAAALTGEKADEMRARGMKMIDTAMQMTQDAQQSVIAAGKQVAKTTDNYVKEHPWGTLGTAATVGLLVGLLCSRKS
ncbi:DUF883 family protein [Undibacterium sp. TC9W]|uniref:DUF883 family protein n=1 Tax=Undibacterium sp. TC9W TaxID=3413053 RepID=UPI003BF0C1A7